MTAATAVAATAVGRSVYLGVVEDVEKPKREPRAMLRLRGVVVEQRVQRGAAVAIGGGEGLPRPLPAARLGGACAQPQAQPRQRREHEAVHR